MMLKLFSAFVIVMIAGCASDDVFIPMIPQEARSSILQYKSEPANKVFVIAIDPGGDFAYGTASGKETLSEALREAALMIEKERQIYRVAAKPYVYAVNNEVVFKDMIRHSHRDEELLEDALDEDLETNETPAGID